MRSYDRPSDFEQMWSNYLRPKSDWQKRKELKANKVAIRAVIMQVLRAGCSTPNWYPVQEIHMNCCRWSGGRKCRLSVTNSILKELGFTHRKIRFGGLQVYINLANPQEQPPKEIKRKRLMGRDLIQQFAKERIQPKEGNLILKTELYAAFLEFCHKMHLPGPSKNSFSWSLPKYVISIKTTRKIVKGRRVAFWRDIALKLPPDAN